MQAGRTRRTAHHASTYLLGPANQSPGIPLRARWITLSHLRVHAMDQRALTRSVNLTIYRMRPLLF
jgi:hypothetical protein